MNGLQKLVTKFYRYRASYYRWNRLLFPSAAEVKLVEIMGGKAFTIGWFKHPATKRPFTFIYSLGKALSDERFGREVRAGRYYIDFGNDVGAGIEVDGKAYHTDIVREFDREVYLNQRNWRIMHIDAIKLWNDPNFVQQTILKFIYR